MLGMTQKQAAKTVGIGERTLRRWETSDLWTSACAEARGKWLAGIDVYARLALMRTLQSDKDPVRRGLLALQILERVDPRFAPPRRV